MTRSKKTPSRSSSNPVLSDERPYRVVIVGRPNVGKSTLFNRLIGRRRALVHDLPGVTRDRIEAKAQWWVSSGERENGRTTTMPLSVLLVDTGGLGGERFTDEIQRQVEAALTQADSVIAVFDAQTGVTSADEALLLELRRKGIGKKIPLICAINKVDAEKHENFLSDFFSLGAETVLAISAEHGRGIDDLKEAVSDAVGARERAADLAQPEDRKGDEEADADAEGDDFTEQKIPRIAIVGRPNVGKSTLVNALLREERMITSPIAGTTVDTVDSQVELGGNPYILLDTAGIRRKSKTEQGIEVLSVLQAKKALERADVAILLLDGEGGITEQDEKIGGMIEEAGCGVILAVNKWDTQRRNKGFTQEVAAEAIRKEMGFLRYAPIAFLSAKERTGLRHFGELAEEILTQRQIRIPTHEFTEWVRQESQVHNPENAKFYLCHQAGRNPPTFVCHVNDPKKVHFSLKRHLINALRTRWGYMGSPIRMLFVSGKKKKE